MGLVRDWWAERLGTTLDESHDHDDHCDVCSGRAVVVEIPVEWLGPEYTDFALVRDARL